MNAQNLKDSTYEKSQSLNDVNITAKKISSFLKRQDATTKLDITFINTLPKILGNTDPIHYLQTMPGISTNNEYDAGIHIMGCSTGHNLVGINGIPVYTPDTFLDCSQHSILLISNPSQLPHRQPAQISQRESAVWFL